MCSNVVKEDQPCEYSRTENGIEEGASDCSKVATKAYDQTEHEPFLLCEEHNQKITNKQDNNNNKNMK